MEVKANYLKGLAEVTSKMMIATGMLAFAAATVLTTAPANAQSVKPEDAVPVAKKWNVVTGLSQSQNLYYTNNGQDSASTDFSLSARYRVQKNVAISASTAVSYDNKQEESDWTSASVGASVSRIPIAQGNILWTPSASLQLPANRRTLATSMRTTLGFSNRFDIDSEKRGWTRLSAAYMLSGSYAWYEYETSVSGAVNSPLRLNQAAEVSWALSDQVYLVGFVSHGVRRTAFDNWSESITHSEEIYAQATPKLGFSFGHQLGSNIRAANGQDLNLRLQDDTNSQIYLQMTYIL